MASFRRAWQKCVCPALGWCFRLLLITYGGSGVRLPSPLVGPASVVSHERPGLTADDGSWEPQTKGSFLSLLCVSLSWPFYCQGSSPFRSQICYMSSEEDGIRLPGLSRAQMGKLLQTVGRSFPEIPRMHLTSSTGSNFCLLLVMRAIEIIINSSFLVKNWT